MGKSRDSPTRETREPLGDLTFKARIIKIEVRTPCFFKKKKIKIQEDNLFKRLFISVANAHKNTQKQTKKNNKK